MGGRDSSVVYKSIKLGLIAGADPFPSCGASGMPSISQGRRTAPDEGSARLGAHDSDLDLDAGGRQGAQTGDPYRPVGPTPHPAALRASTPRGEGYAARFGLA